MSIGSIWALLLMTASCGDDPPARDETVTPSGPAETAAAFAHALGEGDAATACSLLTSQARKSLEALARARGLRAQCKRVSIASLKPWFAADGLDTSAQADVDGRRGTVKVAGVGLPIHVVRQRRAWRADPTKTRSVYEAIGLETACSGLQTVLRRTRPLPDGPGEARARALLTERRAVRGYRRVIARIDRGEPRPANRTSLMSAARDIERSLAAQAATARGAPPATTPDGVFLLADLSPERLVHRDRQEFAADCGR